MSVRGIPIAAALTLASCASSAPTRPSPAGQIAAPESREVVWRMGTGLFPGSDSPFDYRGQWVLDEIGMHPDRDVEATATVLLGGGLRVTISELDVSGGDTVVLDFHRFVSERGRVKARVHRVPGGGEPVFWTDVGGWATIDDADWISADWTRDGPCHVQ